MQQLKHVILQKINFKKKYTIQKITSQSKQQIQKLIHCLILQKKKQSSNESIQTRLTNSIMSVRLFEIKQLMQFYQTSRQLTMMHRNQSQDNLLISTSKAYQYKQAQTSKSHQNQQKSHQYKQKSHQNEQKSYQNEQKSNKYNLQTNQRTQKAKKYSRDQIVFKIVKVFYDFYIQNNFQSKAQQIMHMYKKRLCQQGFIVPTMLCWFNDWVRRQYATFIKIQLNQLKRHKIPNQQIYQQSITNLSTKYQNQSSIKLQTKQQKQMISIKQQKEILKENKQQIVIKSENRQQKAIKVENKQSQIGQRKKMNMPLPQVQKQIYSQHNKLINQTKQFTNIQKKIKKSRTFHQASPTFKIQQFELKNLQPISKQPQHSRQLTLNVYQISNLFPMKSQVYQPIHNRQSQETIHFNREILIGAYYQKFHNYYKALQKILPDLDISFIRKVKRNDRKKDIHKNIKQLGKVLVRTQPLIKASIDQYQIHYLQKIKKLKPLKSVSQTIKTRIMPMQSRVIKNSKFFTLDQSLKQIDNQVQIENREISLPSHTSQTRQKQQFKVQRPIKLQLNLPRIPQNLRKIPSLTKQSSKIVIIQSSRFNPSFQTLDNSPTSKKSKYSYDNGSMLEILSQSIQAKYLLQQKKQTKRKLIDKILNHSAHLEINHKDTNHNHKDINHQYINHQYINHKDMNHQYINYRNINHQYINHQGINHQYTNHTNIDHKYINHQDSYFNYKNNFNNHQSSFHSHKESFHSHKESFSSYQENDDDNSLSKIQKKQNKHIQKFVMDKNDPMRKQNFSKNKPRYNMQLDINELNGISAWDQQAIN